MARLELTRALCRKSVLSVSYEAKLRATVLTVQIRYFDGHARAAKALQFPSWITTTLLQCSDGTLVQNGKFDALDGTNSTAGETCVAGRDLGDEVVSGNSLGTLTVVSKNESLARLAGSLSACRVTRRSTCINLRHLGVSESCQAACTVGFESANRTEPSRFVIIQSESNSAPPHPVHEEKQVR